MTRVGHEVECPYAEDDDLLRRYAAGLVDGEDAESFEQHYFECERCWNEMQDAAQIRSALRQRAQPHSQPRARRVTPILAMAAAAVLVVLGLWQVRRQDDEGAWRAGAARELAVRVASSGRGPVLSWDAVAGADRYLVQIFRADGSLVLKAETAGTRFEVTRPSEGTYVKIDALNETGSVIVTSRLKPLQ